MSEKTKSNVTQVKTISLSAFQYDEIFECAGALSELSFLCKKAAEGGEEFPGRTLETIYDRLSDVLDEIRASSAATLAGQSSLSILIRPIGWHATPSKRLRLNATVIRRRSQM